MSEETQTRFLFTFSAEGTKLLQEGKVNLSSGGLRNLDGSLFEMGKPISFEPVVSDDLKAPKKFNSIENYVCNTNKNLDLIIAKESAVQRNALMNYALTAELYEMTYSGFQRIIEKIDSVYSELTRLRTYIEEKDTRDKLEFANRYRNNLTSIAGFMDTKKFDASLSFLNVVKTIDEVEANLDRLYGELKSNTDQTKATLASIIIVAEPYCYVVDQFSLKFYFENGKFPPNYVKWVATIQKILHSPYFEEQLRYYLRIDQDWGLEDACIASKKVIFNFQQYTNRINFNHKYVLMHSEDQFLSINEQIEKNWEDKKYEIIKGHLCIEVN